MNHLFIQRLSALSIFLKRTFFRMWMKPLQILFYETHTHIHTHSLPCFIQDKGVCMTQRRKLDAWIILTPLTHLTSSHFDVRVKVHSKLLLPAKAFLITFCGTKVCKNNSQHVTNAHFFPFSWYPPYSYLFNCSKSWNLSDCGWVGGGESGWDTGAVFWWRCLRLFSYFTEHLFIQFTMWHFYVQ